MADGAVMAGDKRSKRPKVAFTGEEFGFGYQAVSQVAANFASKAERILPDGGFSAVHKINNKGFDLTAPERQPLFTKEQALVAVRNKTADLAVVPFYSPFTGYDAETLTTMSSLFTLIAVDQVDATDRFCLAVYEPQLLDLVQSAHPGSGLSTLLRDKRSHWAQNDRSRFADPFDPGGEQSQQYAAGYQPDASMQYMLRERVDMIFAGPEASRRCKTKLDGLRGAGIEVRETLQTVEPHREMARLARGTLNNSRQTNTFFDPRDGKTHFVSSMQAENQNTKLYGVVMPFEIAMRSSDYVIIDDDIEDANPEDEALKTRFFVVRDIPDLTILEERLALTEERTKHWMKRLRGILDDNRGKDKDITGVRVMLRFRRENAAAAIGEVEDHLRNAGIRYAVVKIGEDSGKDSPAPIVLDMELDAKHFKSLPFAGSDARMALWLSFARWKKRAVSVIAAMPVYAGQEQLPARAPRRWWKEGFGDYMGGAFEAMWVRYRVLLGGLIGAGAVGGGWLARSELSAILANVQKLLGGG